MEVTESPERLVIKRQSLIPFQRTGKRSGGELDQVAAESLKYSPSPHPLKASTQEPPDLSISRSHNVLISQSPNIRSPSEVETKNHSFIQYLLQTFPP